MDERTTTEDQIDAGATSAEPADQSVSSAAEKPEEPTTQEDDQSGADDSDNLAWLQKKGIDANDPEAIGKVAEMYRNAEKAMHQSASRASELERALNTDESSSEPAEPLEVPDEVANNPIFSQLVERLDTLEKAQQATNTVQSVNQFFANNPDARDYEQQMAQIVTDNSTMGQLVKSGYLGYDQLYAMAKGADANRDANLKSEGGQQALKQVADKQQGKAAVGRATSSAMSADQVTPANVEAWYAGLTPAERADPANQQKISSLLA